MVSRLIATSGRFLGSREAHMISRRAFAAGSALVAAFAHAATAMAAEARSFDPAAFAAAKAAGKSILVEVTAPWCPTCRAQKPILSELLSTPALKDIVVFEVDFDSRKDVLRSLDVRQQSTLIVFKGAMEAGRSTGDTSRAGIAALLGAAI